MGRGEDFYEDKGIGREGEGWRWFRHSQGVTDNMRGRSGVSKGSRRAHSCPLGLFDCGGGEPPSSLLLLLEGEDGSGWSVAGNGGGGVLPTGAGRAGSQLGLTKK